MEKWIWVLEGEPKDIVIVDRDGNERHPDLEKIKRTPRLKPALVAGSRYGRGVGALFYGGRLGNKEELAARGNQYLTNDAILRAIGYEKGPQANPPAQDD